MSDADTTLYAIRHDPSGMYLPAPRGRDGRGGTHVEPSPEMPPRLFVTDRAAESALRYWLAGPIHVSRTGGGYDSLSNEYYECDETWTVERVETRIKADMTVVPVRLVFP